MDYERIEEISPGGIFKVTNAIKLIWDAIDIVNDKDSFRYIYAIKNLLIEIIAWIDRYIGFGYVGIFCIPETGEICFRCAEESATIEAFKEEYIYELELLGFIICAYYGFDYRHICSLVGRYTDFEYDQELIYQEDNWISEDRCYYLSFAMLDKHRKEYEGRIKNKLSSHVTRHDFRRKKTRGDYKRFYLPSDSNVYNTSSKKFNDEIKKRIVSSDKFTEVKNNLPFLQGHQKAGCLLAEKYDKFAFFYDTGTGKTIMSLAIISEKQRKNNSSFLILAPLAIIENAWLEDAYNYFPKLKILPLSSNFNKADYRDLYEKWRSAGSVPRSLYVSQMEWDTFERKADYKDTVAYLKLLAMADHYIVNIEKYRRDPEEFLFDKVDGLIVDESALLKNPYTNSSKMVNEYSEEYKYIYLLSGKPAPNNSFEYYMQMRIVNPEVFDMSPADFKQVFFTQGSRGIVFKNDYYEKIAASMIAQRSLIVSKGDCLDLKEQHENIVSIRLDSQSLLTYKKVMKGCFKKIEEEDYKESFFGRHMATSRRLAIVTKLREVASGFLIDEYKNIQEIHDKKISVLEKIIKMFPNEQFVIWCNFLYEIEKVTELLSGYGIVVDAYGKTKDLQKNIRDFKQKKARFLVAHPKTLKYGVTLVNCQRAIYYSLSYSAEDYYQSHDRIYRMGQERECYFYFLLAQGTIDETMYECVKNKMGYADMFLQIVKHASDNGVVFKDKERSNGRNVDFVEYRKIKNEYEFAVSGDYSFSYTFDGEEKNSILRNTTLTQFDLLYPEEMLFEIGFDFLFGGVRYVDYRKIVAVSEWVKKQLRHNDIDINKRIRDYLDEQEDKQYQQDIARGIAE